MRCITPPVLSDRKPGRASNSHGQFEPRPIGFLTKTDKAEEERENCPSVDAGRAAGRQSSLEHWIRGTYLI